MLRTLITKQHAAVLVTVLAVLCALATIWPLRLYREDHVFAGNGQIEEVSEVVDEEHDAGDYFTAQYGHLDRLGVWISSVEQAGQLHFQLFLTENGVNSLKAEELVDLEKGQDPGFVEIPVDAVLDPGKTYVFLVRGSEGASFTVGMESLEASADALAPVYQQGFYHDTSVNGLAVAIRLTYREPLGKAHSALVGFAVVLTGLAVLLGIALHGLKHPGENGMHRLTTLDAVMRYTLTPPVVAVGLFFLVCVWLQKFDERLLDNVLYTVGILLTLLVILFGLWHDRTGLPDMMNREILSRNWLHYVISICVALILAAGTMYMNATSDTIHDQAERYIVILLCIIALCMVHGRRSTDERDIGESGQTKLRLWLILPLCGLGVLMLIFANGRRWIPVMLVVYVILYLRFLFWRDQDAWLSDLSRGIVLNFGVSVVYTLVHRYYFAFIYSRFPMMFHTVTVTAYYLLIVGCAALQLLVIQCRRVFDGEHHSFWWYADRLWKEAVLYGTVCAYMMMSLSRAGIFELALFSILALVLVSWEARQAGSSREQKSNTEAGSGTVTEYTLQTTAGARTGAVSEPEKRAFAAAAGTLCCMVLSVVIMLPAVFTSQRLVSTVCHSPVWYEEVEPYPDEVVRHPAWNDKWFMSWEVFIRDFGDRVIGGESGSKIYDHFDWGAHQKVQKAEDWVVNRSVSRTSTSVPVLLLTRTSEVQAGESLEGGDYSNGRLLLWRTYLHALNLTGHDTMGAVLPDGSVAVHAHNNALQLAYDCGIPAGLLFLLLQILIIAASGIYYKECVQDRRDGFALMQLFLVLGFTITGTVEWTWTLCNPFCLMYLMSSAPLFLVQERERPDNE